VWFLQKVLVNTAPLRLTYDEIIFIQESRGSDVVKVIGEQHIDDDPSSERIRQKTPANFLKEHFDIRTPLIITRKLSVQTSSFNFRNENFVRQLSDGANYISQIQMISEIPFF